jgi:hypothetical protein
MVKKLIITLSLIFTTLLTGCNRKIPVAPSSDGNLDPTPEEDSSLSAVISGYVWLDENEDNLRDENESPIENARVELILASAKRDVYVATLTTSDGAYSINAESGKEYLLRFVPPDQFKDHLFVRKDEGWEHVDSDVNENGETEPFSVTSATPIELSAGLSPVAVFDPATYALEDPINDCRVPGQQDEQACEGDLRGCEASYDPDEGLVKFVCTLGDVTDYTQFDFYVTLDLDDDPATGKDDGQVEGIDAELYLNSLEPRIQINRYDPNGNYIRGDVISPEEAQPVFGADGEEKIGIQIDQAQAQVRELLEQNPKASFALVTYPPSGGQLRDETQSLAADWDWEAYWKIDF